MAPPPRRHGRPCRQTRCCASGPLPMQEARRRPTRRNPRKVHAPERAARLRPQTSGLGISLGSRLFSDPWPVLEPIARLMTGLVGIPQHISAVTTAAGLESEPEFRQFLL